MTVRQGRALERLIGALAKRAQLTLSADDFNRFQLELEFFQATRQSRANKHRTRSRGPCLGGALFPVGRGQEQLGGRRCGQRGQINQRRPAKT